MKRLLILSQTFFPDSPVGAIRVSQWAKYLPENGWSSAVICWHFGVTATPELLAEHLHPDIEVRYLTERTSGSTAKPRLRQRAARALRLGVANAFLPFTVPDPYAWKWRAYASKVDRLAHELHPDAVLSSSPPMSIHEAGWRVAQRLGVPWIADFRDPYLIDSRFRPRGLRRLRAPQHRRFEHDVYREAALCVHAIPLHARWASRRYGFAREKIRFLPNGFPAELLDERFVQSAERSSRVSIRAVGVLGEGAAATIAAALRQLLDRGIDAEFRHVGRARDAAECIPVELRERVRLLGTVSHLDALREVAGADVLLKYDDLERAQVSGLSSKLFEYLATGRPIVAVNPTRADWQLIGRHAWCWCLENPQPAALAEALQQAITSGAKPEGQWLDDFRRQFNRRNQTAQLAHWLDELVPHPRTESVSK